jgi:cell division protein FtsQ
LQQVGAKAFATASLVDPGKLPAFISYPRRRRMISVRHIWVLHRQRLLQAMAGLVCLAAVGGVFVARDKIGEEGAALYQLGLAKVAHSQFAISRISISGQAITSERDIMGALGIQPQTSMLNFDVDAARVALEGLPAISEATVRKVYPDRLYINVTERVPVARWRLDGTTYDIDPTGAKIGVDDGSAAQLPLVIGDDAGDDAMVMIRAMDQAITLKSGLVALSRIADRRWDMIYKSGLRVQLPEQGVAQALTQLRALESKYQLLDRDISLIDLRVPGIAAVEPSDAAQAQLAAISKANLAKNKGNFKQEADYAAPGTH